MNSTAKNRPDLSSGEETAKPQGTDQLLALIYDGLRKLAAAKMAGESPEHTLQPTALVHEAWLRLAGNRERSFNDRTHFFAAAAEAMRRILVDNARRKRAQRHGGGRHRTELTDIAAPPSLQDDQVIAVNDALNKFTAIDPQKAELVKLRYFVGMTIGEAAAVLGISEGTAKRHWAYARAWLADEIRAQKGPN
jgi:RNA polymerase sigma factor (TIGR02999 family)